MKVAIACKDAMLEKTLMLLLKRNLSSKKDCDFLIVDHKIQHAKAQFVISKNSGHLQIPFTKEQLLEALFEFKSTIEQDSNRVLSFEEKLEVLLNQLKYDLIKLINEK